MSPVGPGGRMHHPRLWGARLAVHLGLRPDDWPPDPPAEVDPGQSFTLTVAQTDTTATVTVEGALDGRSCRWLQEVLLDLIAAREVLDIDLHLRAEVVDGPALDRVASVVGTFAGHEGMTVVRTAGAPRPLPPHPAGRARPPDDLAAGDP